jgi:hypothetical protein
MGPITPVDFNNPAFEKLLTAEDVAQRLTVSPGWVRDHSVRKRPRLPAIRVGRFLRYRQQDLEGWIAEQTGRVSADDRNRGAA